MIKLSTLDWGIIIGFMVLSLGFGLYMTRRASKSLGEFFLSGRNLTWWLAGTSMVATTFSCDTPLYVTAIVRSKGVYANWQWWGFLFGGMFAMAFLSKLWRRSEVVTDVELIALRYSGRASYALRGIKALYYSCIINTIIKVQVILAMTKILEVTIGWDKWPSIIIASIVPLIYSIAAGLWGVVVTDFVQFIIASIGAIALAVYSVDKVGGIGAIRDALPPDVLGFMPPGEMGGLAFLTFFGYVGLFWWSKYSSDGGGAIVQRVAACKTERDGYAAMFLFNTAHYAIRTWPWVLAALASMVLYPTVADNDSVYAMMVVDILPSGLRGLVLASFVAAFMSTLSTHLNLSSSYFVNDFYEPFVAPDKDQGHYILVSRLVIVALSVLTAVATFYANSIEGVFTFLIAFGSGTGLVFILRWFWWRINAWSEISAMAASTVMSIIVYRYYADIPYIAKLVSIIVVSTVIWVSVTFMTQPVSMDKLTDFVRRVKPMGPGWSRIRSAAGGGVELEGEPIGGAFAEWALGSFLVLGLTVGIGKILLVSLGAGVFWISLAVFSALGLWSRYRPKGQ